MPVRGVMVTLDHSDIIVDCLWTNWTATGFGLWRGIGDVALYLLSAEYLPKHMDEIPLFYFKFFVYAFFFPSF